MTSSLDTKATFGVSDTHIERVSSDMKFTDSNNPSGITLSSLVSIRRTDTINLDIDKNLLTYREPFPHLCVLSPATNTNTKMTAFGFNDSIEQFIGYSFRLPKDLDTTGTVNFKLQWIPSTASANNVVWKVYYTSYGEGESIDVAMSTLSGTSAGSATADVISERIISATVSTLGWSGGDHAVLHFSRDATSGSDTLSGDANLVGLTIELPVKNVPPRTSSNNSTNIQEFTTSGTWTKPAGIRFMKIYLVAGGGGGGSGRRGAAATYRSGGQGGFPGASLLATFFASDFAETVPVTVGLGGAGGAAQSTNNTNGNDGSVGGDTSFGPLIIIGGPGGEGGINEILTEVSQAGNMIVEFLDSTTWPSSGGGRGSGQGQDGNSNPTHRSPTGGGGGGGVSNVDTQSNGGDGGENQINDGSSLVLAGGAGGSSDGGNGTDAIHVLSGGTGGGGGAGKNTGINAGNGGNGGYPGGGGGGGGGVLNGNNSGAGGSGGNGKVVIISW